jgi:hypothetical protein
MIPPGVPALPEHYESVESEVADTLGAPIDNVQVNFVPVPAAVWLLGGSLLGLPGLTRLKAQSACHYFHK